MSWLRNFLLLLQEEETGTSIVSPFAFLVPHVFIIIIRADSFSFRGSPATPTRTLTLIILAWESQEKGRP